MSHFNSCFYPDSPRAPSTRGFAPLSRERGGTSASGRWGEYLKYDNKLVSLLKVKNFENKFFYPAKSGEFSCKILGSFCGFRILFLSPGRNPEP